MYHRNEYDVVTYLRVCTSLPGSESNQRPTRRPAAALAGNTMSISVVAR